MMCSAAVFSLLLCSKIYATFVRPKFEYGLAIAKLSPADFKALEKLQDRCLRLFVGGHATSSTVVLKHMTDLPSMKFRCEVLSARFALRSLSLPPSCLLSLLIPSLSVSLVLRSISSLLLYTLPFLLLHLLLPPSSAPSFALIAKISLTSFSPPPSKS